MIQSKIKFNNWDIEKQPTNKTKKNESDNKINYFLYTERERRCSKSLPIFCIGCNEEKLIITFRTSFFYVYRCCNCVFFSLSTHTHKNWKESKQTWTVIFKLKIKKKNSIRNFTNHILPSSNFMMTDKISDRASGGKMGP